MADLLEIVRIYRQETDLPIFIRPNAVGEKGALTAYGSQSRPEFDYNRT